MRNWRMLKTDLGFLIRWVNFVVATPWFIAKNAVEIVSELLFFFISFFLIFILPFSGWIFAHRSNLRSFPVSAVLFIFMCLLFCNLLHQSEMRKKKMRTKNRWKKWNAARHWLEREVHSLAILFLHIFFCFVFNHLSGDFVLCVFSAADISFEDEAMQIFLLPFHCTCQTRVHACPNPMHQ